MKEPFISVLISEEKLNERIAQLGEQISKDYEGKEVKLICILKGSIIFTCELAKRITVPVKFDFMQVSSYGCSTVSSGKINILKDISISADGKNVVVVDDTLLESVEVTAGLKEDGAIIINTTKNYDYLKNVLNGYNGKVYTIDAREISMEALGKYFPNTPMLAAVVKVTGIMTDEEFLNDMQGSFKHKFAKKPEVIDGNMKALQLALNQVNLIS